MRDIPDQAAAIAIIGLGYVGLPLAVEFGRLRPTIGFDIDPGRISTLAGGQDWNLETTENELQSATYLEFTDDYTELAAAGTYIITVPTPIDAAKRPDLQPLVSASQMVGRTLAAGDVVVYESTVYPGATEEVCVPELEAASGLTFNQDFFVGYSPERINPGDKQNRLPDIIKVTSGSDSDTADTVDALYREIIKAGTHRAPSIRVAEAAKVIENTQRDVNIALINELAILFGKLDIDTQDVLAAAGTKWNFLKFSPGLVGGHCIGVDPYYLTHKAQEVGHHPEVILAGRRINDGMGRLIADRVVQLMGSRNILSPSARVLVLGLAFKENCPDIRNTRVTDIVDRIGDYGLAVDVVDPWVGPADAKHEYGLDLCSLEGALDTTYDAVVLAVAHDEFTGLASEFRNKLGPNAILYDVKGAWPRALVDGRL